MSPADRAELENTERWWREKGDHAAADRVRRLIDYHALPAAQRRALDEARELREDQLRHLVTFCEDSDIVLMTAAYMLGGTSADGISVRCCDGTKMHCADIDRGADGQIQVTVTLDGDWPYQRQTVGNA